MMGKVLSGELSCPCDRSCFFQNNPKNLDPSFKMDLDLWDCLGWSKTCIIAKFHRTDLVIFSHSREGKTLSCSQINMVLTKYANYCDT